MKQIRSSKFSKFLAYYLAIMMFIQVTQPMQMYALTSGPTQPEFNAFTPIGTSDMVDLASGDFNYNIPIMDVGGYPLNLAYNSGVTMDQEASWVGLGWNLNVGQIERQVRGLPDDFNGEKVTYTTNLKPNRTVGFNFRTNGQFVGFESSGMSLGGSIGMSLQYNNYSGISATPSLGVSFNINENVGVGMNLTSSATEGVTVNPSVTVSTQKKINDDYNVGLSASLGLSYNSRQGLQNYSLTGSTSVQRQFHHVNGGFSSRERSKSIGGSSGTATINFVNNTYTPTIRNEFSTSSGTFNASLGAHAYLFEVETGVGGFFSSQKLKNKTVNETAYGYEYTDKASENDILDFNRENDRSVSKNTRVLPVTNYTYDVYNMQTQGLSGSFRPYQSQVGYVFDANKSDNSKSGSLGLEVEFGWGFHAGADVEYSTSDVRAGIWNVPVKSYFKSSSAEKLDYEKNYYKLSSDLTLDNEINLYTDKLATNKTIDFKLLDIRNLKNEYRVKSGGNYTPLVIADKIKRSEREKRNQSIQKITKKEAAGDATIKVNDNAELYHTAGYKAVNDDGSTYVFGETVYNNLKNEVTFAVNKNAIPDDNGIIAYSRNDASISNSNGIDNYYNKISTPSFTNTYLLTSVLSTDYEDLTGNGVSDDDLGSYTKFVYKDYGDYKWRAPYYGASYTPGFNSDKNHKKASYTYGEKEVKYISRIETKTHVAIFELSPRKDGLGVNNELNLNKNIASASVMYKIDKIKLYSKPEAIKANLLNNSPFDDLPLAPIKTAHFEYSYDLCIGIHNNYGTANGSEISNNGGKLTLKKVYFTYRNSNMGKYTPYVFDYDESSQDSNPDYDMKSFDVWGNYKKNNGTGRMYPTDIISSVEFPYVDQSSQIEANKNTSAWHLRKVKLPSGGEISIETESDDYQFVQNKRAMQMFKVVGVTKGNNSGLENVSNSLYNSGSYGGIDEAKRLVIEVDQDYESQLDLFKNKYIGDHLDKPIFFRFMLNMLKVGVNNYDYVEGYFKIDKNAAIHFYQENDPVTGVKYYAGIPMQLTDMEGGVNGNENVNPISKAGWYFGRQNMNKTVYGLNNDPSSENVFDIVDAIGGSLETMVEIFKGPNGRLRNDKQCAQKFIPEKSFIRLQNPNQKKLGGGCRVKSVKLSDKWDNMLSGDMGSSGTNLNTMDYGQVYDYTLDEFGTSSGVATYEPLGAKDNPLIEPFYDKGERLVAPKEMNYVEKPFGASFFPSPTITYSKVTVKNLPRTNNDRIVKKHATGTVITEFYTYKDFPTKTDFTEIKNGENLKTTAPNQLQGFLAGLLGLPIIDANKLTMSQGFAIETNDMNGKQKSQKIFNENNNLISGVDYHYNINGTELDNSLYVINEEGEVYKSLIGVNYDVINDFRQNISSTKVYGIKGNVSIDIWGACPLCVVTVIPTVIPSYASHNNELRMATTTKVVHKKGILIEKVAYDLGSKVSTKNLLWDASSGQVVLTETVNEYDDHYYSFSYPAYWMYEGMGLASNNIGIEGMLTKSNPSNGSAINHGQPSNNPYFKINGISDLSKYFQLGDELYSSGYVSFSGSIELPPLEGDGEAIGTKLWVVGFNSDKSGILLMDRNGKYINKCDNIDQIPFKIVRSGYRNLQSASMASVTSMINPLKDSNSDGIIDAFNFDAYLYNGANYNPRVVNASAVVYKDFWGPQSESNFPYYPEYDSSLSYDITIGGNTTHNDDNPIKMDGNPNYPYALNVNPYVKNIKGDWRAEKSYAYLTGRSSGNGEINNPRNEGFYNNFSPFYQLNGNNKWEVNDYNWTYASSVTQYSPYGVELENKDALNRHSSAQYGYKYSLPIAVASNAKYKQMGFEGFESDNPHFSFLIEVDGVSSNHSHTGKKSLKVANGSFSTLSSNLNQNKPTIGVLNDCPTSGGGSGGGGTCSSYYSRYGNSIYFTQNVINVTRFGSPNQNVYYDYDSNPDGGYSNYVNVVYPLNQSAWSTEGFIVTLENETIYFWISISGCSINGDPNAACIHSLTCDFDG